MCLPGRSSAKSEAGENSLVYDGISPEAVANFTKERG